MEHYTQFTMADRCLFQNYLSGGLKIREIASRMKKHASTLYRELARNNDNGVYLPSVAHKKALARCRRPSTIELNPTLKSYIHQHLRLGWSPEQIAGRLKRKKSKYAICHETIYRYIYKKKTSSLIYLLTRKKPKRIRHLARKKMKCRFGEKRLITNRPISVEKRLVAGHWEGDLILFKGTRRVTITTLVERKTRMLILIKNDDNNVSTQPTPSSKSP